LNLVDEIHSIFLAMLPTFISMAKKYNVPNAADWAQEWQTKAFLIALKFDEGSLVKKGLEEGTEGLTEDVDEASFLRSFRGYLATSFKNDLYANFAKNKGTKNVSLYTPEGDTISSLPVSKNNSSELDPVYIEDIVLVVQKDIKKNSAAESASEACKLAFEKALLVALKSMQEKWSNIPILANSEDEFESSKIAIDFMPEWKERTKFALAHELIAETCPFTVQKISAVLFSKQDFALTKRFERYLVEYMGGMSKRIRRNKK